MSAAKFTPGPWHISKAPTRGWPITRTGDYYISSAPMRGGQYGDELADLNLIAAAPEMYAALKEIDDSWAAEGWTPENAKARTQFTDDTIERWKNIRAALAKARGEAQ